MKKLALVVFLFLVALTLAIPAAAQTAAVKGKCVDQEGKPIPAGTVQFDSIESGRQMKIKFKNGEYMALGMSPGTYKVTLLDPEGKVIYTLNKVPVSLDSDKNVIDFDLKKEAAGGGGAPNPAAEEARKKQEAAKAENNKIGNLNNMLKQAAEMRTNKQCDQAVEIMTQATQVAPDKHQLWNSLAESDACANKFPDAITAYKKAIELNPTSGAYYNNMAGVMVKTNQFDDAIAAYNKAAELDPPQAAMYFFNEGAVLYNRGKMDESAKAFDKVLAIDPNKADAYYYKGAAQLGKATIGKDGKMEAPEGTAEAFNKYLELQPAGAHAEEAKAMLGALGAKVETSFGKERTKKK